MYSVQCALCWESETRIDTWLQAHVSARLILLLFYFYTFRIRSVQGGGAITRDGGSTSKDVGSLERPENQVAGRTTGKMGQKGKGRRHWPICLQLVSI